MNNYPIVLGSRALLYHNIEPVEKYQKDGLCLKRIKAMIIGSKLEKLDAETSILKIKLKEEQAAHEKIKSQLKVYKYIVISISKTLDEIQISHGLKKRILNKIMSMMIIK